MIFGQNSAKYQAYSLTFWRKLAHFSHFSPCNQNVRNNFGQNSAKYQAYSLTFWQKFAHFSHFSLYNQNLGEWLVVKIRQNTKPIALLFGENWPILATFHPAIKV